MIVTSDMAAAATSHSELEESAVRPDGIAITLREHDGVARRGEVVTLGVPLPRGLAAAGQRWHVRQSCGAAGPCQTRPLAQWPDGSVKWLLTSFAASTEAQGQTLVRLVQGGAENWLPAGGASVARFADRLEVDTGRGVFTLPASGGVLLRGASVEGAEILARPGLSVTATDRRGREHVLQLDAVEVVEAGPLQVQVAFRGRLSRMGLNCRGVWTFHANSMAAQLEITLHNPSRARHSGGCWDLGDPASVCFRELALTATPGGDGPAEARWCEAGEEWQQAAGDWEIFQASSGGEAFNSRNHVNASGQSPIVFRGYRLRCDGADRFGLRAQPVVAMQRGENWIAAAIAEFWQQFPKAISANQEGMRIGLFPAQFVDGHELQGGEQKTHSLAFHFGNAGEPDLTPLASLVSPLEILCDNLWLLESGAIHNLPADTLAAREEWHAIARHALEGERSFFAKREVIDEYGWRNYGELWADHEEAYYEGPRPIISHYNNQYDGLQGFLLTYLLSGDSRWWQLADPLARHVIDIDIYHTTHDRAVYNGGLFWHTSHYLDAITCTHRSYSKSAHLPGGGGPSNEHNYTSGLLLYYYLTGNRQALQSVEGLAEWVIGMDDGRRHVLGIVRDEPTGFASRTTEPDYHGPGRGAGNSINALLDGWLATGRHEFLTKAEELIRRTIHPADDVAALDLGNAELRWSYTVYLQTLLRILASDGEFGLSEELLSYVRDSLLVYARWMAEHERFYLDEPEKLEYPTETWAAQELRKANVLLGAAEYASDAESQAFRRKAESIYERSWSALISMPTSSYTRPTVLALQLGLVEASLRQGELGGCYQPSNAPRGGEPAGRFVPQKSAVRQALRSPRAVAKMGLTALQFWRWPAVMRATWPAQCLRTWSRRMGITS